MDNEKARKPAFVFFQYKPDKKWKSAGKGAYGDNSPELVSLAPGEQRTIQIPLRAIM